ncbi:hypothetical protein [Aliiglaciecola litoralis]
MLKPTFIISLVLISCVSLSFSPTAFAKKDDDDKKQKKDKIEVQVLQNKEHNECMFMDDVVISVKYKLKSMDYGVLTAELSNDGSNFYEAASLDIDRGNSKVIMSFDAGACATDMRVVIK